MANSKMTVKEIKQELDTQGIEYNNRAKKADLLKLLQGNNDDKTTEETPKQKKYVVVYHKWRDEQDNDKIYKKGDTFNWVGKSKERIKSLSTKNNKIGKVLIKETE